MTGAFSRGGALAYRPKLCHGVWDALSQALFPHAVAERSAAAAFSCAGGTIRHVRRRLFKLLSALSLLLGMSTILLRVRSYQAKEGILFGSAGGRYWEFTTDKGMAHVVTYWNWPVYQPLRWMRDSVFIGPSGEEAAWFYFWNSQRWNLLVEHFDVRLYVGADNRTPVMGAEPQRTSHTSTTATPMWLVFFPLLYLTGVTAMLPSIWILSLGYSFWTRRNRLARGRCRTCGYDLRATPDRCPECGMVPYT